MAWFQGAAAVDGGAARGAERPQGVLATGLEQVSDDLSMLDDGGWWAVVVDFEGRVVCGRFREVASAPLPATSHPWRPLRGPWSSSLDRTRYLAACQEVRRRIGLGEVYQVNVCRVLEHPLDEDADLWALAALTTGGNPAPYAGVIDLPGAEVVCASPELFLNRSGQVVTTGPIKGTAPTPDALLPKDIDENVMIVDLARNDLSRICQPGTVRVPDLLTLEDHPGLVHLVSRVSGRVRDGLRWSDIIATITPPASVTGTPRSTAMRAIADLEPVPRGPYCGAIGWVQGDRGCLAVGIRSFWTGRLPDGRRSLRFGTGAGITWGSDPLGEWQETELKAARLVSLASAVPADATLPA
jgi:para-aminobenzoate synthetase component 1